MSIKPPKEKDTQRTLVEYLTAKGCLVVRVNSGRMPWTDSKGRRHSFSMNNQPGCSDLIVCLPGGKFAALEVKSAGGKLTPAQASFLDRVRSVGGTAAVIRSTAEADALLNGEG